MFFQWLSSFSFSSLISLSCSLVSIGSVPPFQPYAPPPTVPPTLEGVLWKYNNFESIQAGALGTRQQTPAAQGVQFCRNKSRFEVFLPLLKSHLKPIVYIKSWQNKRARHHLTLPTYSLTGMTTVRGCQWSLTSPPFLFPKDTCKMNVDSWLCKI